MGGNSPSESEHGIWRDSEESVELSTSKQTVHLVMAVLMMPTPIKLTEMVMVWVMNATTVPLCVV